MTLSRRILLAAPALLLAARARADGPLTERAIGKPDAPVTVVEYFSLTCPHCARFNHDTLPQIRADLIDTGKIRYIFRDYPLDGLALAAAQVARSLPPERYVPFIDALLASQNRWAFARNVNNTEELYKMAALAGLSRPAFDAALADKGLREAILADQALAEKTYNVDSTPTFIFSGPAEKNHREAGELTYANFADFVTKVGG